jgi:hypothetical protein
MSGSTSQARPSSWGDTSERDLWLLLAIFALSMDLETKENMVIFLNFFLKEGYLLIKFNVRRGTLISLKVL